MGSVRVEAGRADRAAIVQDVVARLRRGELCALPTETVYGLAALPSHAGAAAQLRELLGRSGPFTLHIADAAALGRLVGTVPAGIERLVARYWPGPLTVVLPGRDGTTIGVRQPANELTQQIIAAAGEPLWLATSAAAAAAARDADQVLQQFGSAVALVVDDGPAPLGAPSTVVCQREDGLEVVREGILSAREVLETAAQLVLFVCTGNTCRSPLATALARRATAEALGVAEQRLLARGFWFASAGTGAYPGMPASDGALAAGGEIGLDLSAHESQPVTPELLARATHVYCLGRSHRRAVLAEVPEAAARTQLLRPDQLDIADPYGGDTRAYRRARDEIRAAITARLGEWLPQPGSGGT